MAEAGKAPWVARVRWPSCGCASALARPRPAGRAPQGKTFREKRRYADNSDTICLTYGSKVPFCHYRPGTTWTTGRNELWKIAVKCAVLCPCTGPHRGGTDAAPPRAPSREVHSTLGGRSCHGAGAVQVRCGCGANFGYRGGGLCKPEILQLKFCTKFLYAICSVSLRICAGIHLTICGGSRGRMSPTSLGGPIEAVCVMQGINK